MKKKNQLPGAREADPVRMIGIGAGGRRLLAALHRGAHGPLADLLGDSLKPNLPEDSGNSAERFELQSGVVILFIAFALDASDADARDALRLTHLARELNIQVIGVAVHPAGGASFANPSLLIEALAGSEIDGLIDIRADAGADELEALRWVYGALRSLSREGVLILEPAWDLFDVVEVLDLPGSQLRLSMHAVAKGVSMSAAVSQALEDVAYAGTDLALASGILVVLWRAPDQVLLVRDVREAARIAGDALGQGGLHLTLTARSKALWGELGGCATVVVSTRRDFGSGEGEGGS